MKRIRDLLLKFSTLAPPERAIKDLVQKAVKEIVGISLTPEEIIISRERIHLRIDSIRRSEVMLYRGALLRRIAEGLPGKRVIREIV